MVDPPPPHEHGPSADLEPEHRRAVCNEIGERLRGALADDAAPLPSRLQGLIERLTELDSDAPPIVPGKVDDPASPPLWKRVLRFFRFP
jgi:hypothetical protein